MIFNYPFIESVGASPETQATEAGHTAADGATAEGAAAKVCTNLRYAQTIQQTSHATSPCAQRPAQVGLSGIIGRCGIGIRVR